MDIQNYGGKTNDTLYWNLSPLFLSTTSTTRPHQITFDVRWSTPVNIQYRPPALGWSSHWYLQTQIIFYNYYWNIPTICGVNPTPCVASHSTGTMTRLIFQMRVFWGILVHYSVQVRLFGCTLELFRTQCGCLDASCWILHPWVKGGLPKGTRYIVNVHIYISVFSDLMNIIRTLKKTKTIKHKRFTIKHKTQSTAKHKTLSHMKFLWINSLRHESFKRTTTMSNKTPGWYQLKIYSTFITSIQKWKYNVTTTKPLSI